MRPSPSQRRATYARTNFANKGFKDNTPGGWVDTNGPVWWYGSDRASAYLSLSGQPAGIAAVSRAINLITNRIAAAQWRVDPDTPRWILDPMLLRPREGDTTHPAGLRLPRSMFWGAWIRQALTYGMGWLVFQPDNGGLPLAGTLLLLDPDAIDPDPDGWTGGGTGRRRITLQNGRTVDTDSEGYFGGNRRLVELRNPTTPYDPVTGTTPGTLAYHAAELGLIDSQLVYASSMYSGSGVPSGYLKSALPLTQEQTDGLRTAWDSARSGGRNTAILTGSLDYQAVGVSPVDAAIADMKRLSLQDVANAFGVPGYLLGAPEGGSMTYSNVQTQMQALYEFTLLPWTVAVEETLSALLPGSQRLDIRPTGEEVPNGGLDRPAQDAGRQLPSDGTAG